MRRIPFNILNRPEIEAGKYKVETEDGTHNVRIVCWDAKGPGDTTYIVGLQTKKGEDTEKLQKYYVDGTLVSANGTSNAGKNLVILTDIPKLTEFEACVKACLNFNYGLNLNEEDDVDRLKSVCKSILTFSKAAIRKEMMNSVKMEEYREDSDLAKNAIGELTVCGFLNNRSRQEIADWLKDVPMRLYHSGNVKLPVWKKAYAGTHFDGLAITYTPSGKDYPRLTSTAQTDCLYIRLDELFELPTEEK